MPSVACESRQNELFFEGGVMRSVGSHDAVGVTWFVAFDSDAVSTGPGARYRRWLTTRQSLDAGAGIALASSDYDAATVFGLIRYSPAPWVGLTVRPERIRRASRVCDPDTWTCDHQPDNHVRVLAGVDLSGKPGAIASSAYGASVALWFLLASLAWGGGG